MNSFTEAALTVASLIVGVAALSVIVSKNSNTTAVIQAGASGFSNALGTAMSPVTGANIAFTTTYPALSGGSPNVSAGSPSLAG